MQKRVLHIYGSPEDLGAFVKGIQLQGSTYRCTVEVENPESDKNQKPEVPELGFS